MAGQATGTGDVPVVSYARISDDGENDGHGVRDQHKVNLATAKRLGWRIVHKFTDNDKSASKADVFRPDFEAMLRAIERGSLDDGTPIQGVIVLADDRLARRAGDYERFVEAVTKRDGRVYADERGMKDLYSEDVEGLGLVGVAFSKIESRKVRRRIRRWHRSRAESGRTPGGNRPFGWRADDRTELEPVEAALLQKAAQEFLAGRSLNSIVRSWREMGLKTSLGNEWTAITLKLALNNPRMCGWRRLGGEILSGEDGRPVVGEWAPIITTEEWLSIHEKIESRKGKFATKEGASEVELPPDFRDHKYLLTGIVRCGKTRDDGAICGARMRVMHSRDCVQHIYACPPRTSGGCAGVGRRGDMVDAFVTEALLAKLEERHAAADEVDEWKGAEELTRHMDRLATLRKEWSNGGISDGFFFSTVRQVEARISELRKEQARLISSRIRAEGRVADVRGAWYAGTLDLSQKRAYVKEALTAVIIYPVGGGRKKFNPDLLQLVWRD